MRKLAIALNVPEDMLLFDEDERKPPADFLLQFQALEQLESEDKMAVRSVIDGLIMRNKAKKLIGQDTRMK